MTRLENVLTDLSRGDYLVSDGATDWDIIDLLNELDQTDLDTEVYCQVSDDADETGQVGYIARFDDAGYILSSPPMYRIKRTMNTPTSRHHIAAPGDYHEAWARIWDDIDGEYLSGTVETVPNDQTFVVRAVPSGRLWECRHDHGEVLECEVIDANL